MPCHVDESPEEQEKRTREHFNHNSEVAEMLCALLTENPLPTNYLNKIHPGIVEWWELHKLRDEAKAKREKNDKKTAELRKNALSKLTPAERRALGVDRI